MDRPHPVETRLDRVDDARHAREACPRLVSRGRGLPRLARLPFHVAHDLAAVEAGVERRSHEARLMGHDLVGDLLQELHQLRGSLRIDLDHVDEGEAALRRIDGHRCHWNPLLPQTRVCFECSACDCILSIPASCSPGDGTITLVIRSPRLFTWARTCAQRTGLQICVGRRLNTSSIVLYGAPVTLL